MQRLAALREALEKRYDLEGEKAGTEGSTPPGVRRLCNLMGKGRVFEELAIEPIALEMARLVIGEDMRWQAMNFHDPMPGDPRPIQAIHADRSFFKNCTAYLNVVWALDDMTEENGATRLVPGSHKNPGPEIFWTISKRQLLEKSTRPVRLERAFFATVMSGMAHVQTFQNRPGV